VPSAGKPALFQRNSYLHGVACLQRTIGNQAVDRLLRSDLIQTEPATGQSDGIDAVAHELSRVTHPDLSSRGALVQRKIATKNVPIDDYLSAKDITGFKKEGSVYSHLGLSIDEPEEEIIYNLLSSERTFSVAGVTAGEAKRNIDSHVKARKKVVEHTEKSKSAYRWGVNSSIKMNPRYWQEEKGRWGPKSGVGMVEAAKNVFSNPSRFDYAMACHLAAGVTMVAGSGSAQYTQRNSVTQDDWAPGDWGYIENKGYKPGKSAAGHEGENIIYVGKGQFWGHPQGQKTMKGWEDFIKLWDNKTGKPALWDMRKYTLVGLE